MSHGKLREDKNCLNCGHFVEERFCPNCGQENTETRRPFHFLFTHFIEDFTHYDGQFWKTIKYLLFRPGKLTKEYLAGKRQQFVPPVKLYIFVSFVTFFLPTLFSYSDSPNHSKGTLIEKKSRQEDEKKAVKAVDSLKKRINNENLLLDDSEEGKIRLMGAVNMKEFDSLYSKNQDHKFLFCIYQTFCQKSLRNAR